MTIGGLKMKSKEQSKPTRPIGVGKILWRLGTKKEKKRAVATAKKDEE